MKGHPYTILFCFILATVFINSKGCEIEGVDNWLIAVSRSINDTFRGDILDLSTTNIDAINSITYAEGLNSGPYLDISYTNSRFVISTNAAFESYEEVETSGLIAVTVNFRCTDGIPAFRPFVFRINVVDTNNNAPQFIPSDQFVFTLAPPLPPGFLITGCFNDITVRDIDLTTQRIEFKIEENPYFEIAYDETAQTSDKEFKAILRTTTFIRSIPNSLTYRITATDVDLTSDPPLSTTATVTIDGNSDFEFPEELVFTQAYYLANYTEDDRLVLTESIALVQGYHDSVNFTLHGEYNSSFELIKDGNQLSLQVVTSLQAESLTEQQILLVIRADREYTSGSTATIIVQFPERIDLEFERIHYEGQIEDNSFRLPLLVLTKGYENRSVSAVILGDHSSYFSAVVQDNTIDITTTGLTEEVIEENSFIHLEIAASNDYSTAFAIVTLEIIKNDSVTPVFNKPVYEGAYSPNFSLDLEQIVIVQGYDDSVSISVEGDYARFFQVIQTGTTINLTASDIPPAIFSEQHIILSVEATKPRTVGANAAVIISLPAARQLDFEKTTYKGTLQDNVLNLEEIVLEIGYEDSVDFFLFGSYATYFSVSNDRNVVSINLIAPIPANVILENNNIVLTLSASGANAVTATTSVILDIIKVDITTPVFARSIYVGSYASSLVIENINLIQGFDDSVTFRLDGDHSEYFQISDSAGSVVLSLRSAIPENIMFEQKVLLFNILAEKPLTVGANAAILIKFPPELTESTVLSFTQNTYTGTLENNTLNTDIITLNGQYDSSTEFVLNGEYSSYFALANTENVITISPVTPLPNEVITLNAFLILEIEANRERAVTGRTSVVIEIINQETISPKFAEAYYRGVYGPAGLEFDDEITLLVGYDETVQFRLLGDFANYFLLTQEDNSLNLTNISPLPETVLENNRHLIFSVEAQKPNTLSDHTAIFLDIDTGINYAVVLRFEQPSYLGSLQNNELQLPTIALVNNIQSVELSITGHYASFFTITRENSDIIIQLNTDLPPQILEENTLITLQLEASYPNAVSGFTTIIIEIPKEPNDVPIFEKAYYVGEYSKDNGLVFKSTISLSQGFNQYVSFTLDGDEGQWFTIIENGENNITLHLNSTGIETLDKSHLVFSIVASKPGTLTGSAAIVISLTDVFTDNPIRFLQDYYFGSIEGSYLTLDTMSLESYTDDVTVSITGDNANYFQLTNQNGVFTLDLLNELPNDVIRDNNVLIIILEAQSQNTRTHAAIILEIIKPSEEINFVTLQFEEPYYIGSYNTATGFVFDSPIILLEGYDEDVQFVLQGANSQWFSLIQNQNSVSLTLSSALPDAVLEVNQKLVFTVAAVREGSIPANAVIIIALTDNLTDQSATLGFDRINYIGSLENNVATLQTISLVGDNLEDVTLNLIGELSSYFAVTADGPDVSVSLETVIPESVLPTNRIILLELQASSPQTNSAYATIVFEVVIEDVPSPVQLRFDEVYYIGSYNSEDGLLFNTSITLAEGYDSEVRFSLEGANSQWFSLIQNQNSVSLTLSSALPDAVLEVNQKLVFTVAAVREGSIPANAVIIIALTDNLTDQSATLGFDRINYIGSLENNVATLQTISLVGDNLEDVTFNLIGELSSYFAVTADGPDVSVSLETVIPESLLPTNRIILLELQASLPQTNSAYATIVFEVVIEDAPSPVQLRFDEVYYIGSYSSEDGLLFNTSITLAEGYDSEVRFSLEGANSQWFSLIQNQNSVSLTLSSALPDAVLEVNQKLVFTVAAVREGSIPANAVIIIALTDNLTDQSATLGFDRINYIGSLENNVATLQTISLVGDNLEDVTLNLIGELSSYFAVTANGPDVSVSLETVIPESVLPTNRIILLELQASSPQTNSAYATIVFEVVIEDAPSPVQLRFDEVYYIGSYSSEDGLLFNTSITLAEGYDGEVQFSLEGANSQWFSLIQNQNSVSLTLSSAIPDAVLEVNQKLVFTVAAVREGSITANAVIIIALTDNLTDQSATLGFDRINYIGSLENNVATLQTISLVGDNLEDVTFNLIGELSSYFAVTADGPDVSVSLETVIPESLLPTNRIILLELQASLPQTNSAYATIVFEVVIEDAPSPVQLRFDEVYYIGSYSSEDGLLFNTSITLAEGYDGEVQFSLEGANSQWFSLIQNQNSVSLTLSSAIPDAVLEVNQKLVFTVAAVREGSITANAVIIIALTDSLTDQSATLGFDRINYIGSLENNVATLQPISLVGDILEDVTLNLIGELSSYFAVTADGPDVSISLETVIPESVLPTNRIILLELQASSPQTNSAYATIVFEVVIEDALSPVQLRFDEVYYIGSYSSEDGLLFNTSIALAEGYDGEVQFSLEGENSQWFNLVQEANSLSLTSLTDIPSTVLENNRKLVFSIKAQRAESISAWATIIISITDPTSPDVSFEKVLYEGVIQFDQVQHELIRILGYSGTDVEIHGEYSSLFTANVVNGLVTVHALGSLNLLSDVATVVLQLHISGARSVLLLNVLHSDIPIQPSVSFSSSTYIVSVHITQTGLVGQVHATADNGEGINYSLLLDSVHLQSRVSINNEGELHLSAPVNSGVYIFKAIATTIISQATANATIHLAVEAITVCGADEFVMPPLIILDRDEEEPHRNLITLNSTNYPDCQFLLTNRWPIDQTWLYVDEDGLHTTSIDREHESIAFMALSQIKVELVLSCEGDNSIRTKRSDRTDWLGDYDYGYNKWILAETIPFNSRRSVVNLIVNDINDNAPIFIGKEDEPIAVGYPTYELEDSVLPRSLAELQATDADIGENAAILYWSPESALAVAPATGFVHVRSGARLYDNQRLEVRATDRNGEGLTGSIQLLVKLLDNSHIAVVTVKDAFLDDEGTILAGLRDAIGYDVRALRSVVVSDDINEEDVSRKKGETDTAQASLRLYVYGLIEKEPVGVDRLKVDIINNAISTINVISTISLEDHLDGCEICVIPGRDTGLLVATIVLSVLLFIIILLIAIWFFLRWRSNKNYDQFSDNNSLASRNNSSGQLPKPESFPKPRLNIQDLKKSERKLQDMLNTPMEAISVEPSASRKVSEVPIESILDLPLPESQGPIVIQSIDKLKDAADDSDDEFGEVNGTRRKSVVTFNENVEKIIHVEDDPEETDNESNGYEIFKL